MNENITFVCLTHLDSSSKPIPSQHQLQPPHLTPSTMVRYNPTSILRNIDLDSVRELRAIMVCIETLVRPPLGPPFVMLTPKDAVTFRLAPTSLAPVNRILQSMEHNYHEFPLLGNAIGRFVAAKDRSNEDVRLAGLELEELAMESTLRFPLVHGGEYEVACDRFARLLCMDKVWLLFFGGLLCRVDVD